MKLYYIIAVAANLVSAILFREYLNISVMSVLPVFFILLSVYQAVHFHNNRSKTDFNTNNDADLTEEEWGQMALYMRNSYLICVPLFIPFVFLFNVDENDLLALVFNCFCRRRRVFQDQT